MPQYRPVEHTPSWDHAETTEAKFVPDYKYATAEEIRNLTQSHLAKLEAELHTLRMAYIVNGRDGNKLVRQGVTLSEEIQRVENLIEELSDYFESVLVE